MYNSTTRIMYVTELLNDRPIGINFLYAFRCRRTWLRFTKQPYRWRYSRCLGYLK